MPAIAKTVATLRFFGDDLDPAAMTARLGAQPSTARSKGEIIRSAATGRERVAKTGSWLFEVADREPGDLNAQIAEVFAALTSDRTVWEELSTRYKADVFVGLFMNASNEGIDLSAQSLALLASRGVSIDFDIYDPISEFSNVQIIDGAKYATFSIFQATSQEFVQVFHAGQDIEIVEDFCERVGETQGSKILEAIWQRPILKSDAKGIHGTLYFGYGSKRRHLPPSKREIDFGEESINPAQQKLFTAKREARGEAAPTPSDKSSDLPANDRNPL